MIEKKAVIPSLNIERRRREIPQELAYIGRMLHNGRISPDTSVYKKLEARIPILREELKKYPRQGDNPKKIHKKTLEERRWGVNTVGNKIYQHYYKEQRSKA